MKYIDAEKLIERLEEMKQAEYENCGGVNSKTGALQEVQELVASLQQEQPEVDLVAELKHHLATTPKDQLEKEWKELEPWGNIGPTVQEFLYGKQPEVDLDESYIADTIQNLFPTDQFIESEYLGLDREEAILFARHFIKLGRDTYKEPPQMEISLRKFIAKIYGFQARYKYPESISIKGAMAFMARMFYQYPNVARQWYDSLPKATMD